jgi:hypothetical protein
MNVDELLATAVRDLESALPNGERHDLTLVATTAAPPRRIGRPILLTAVAASVGLAVAGLATIGRGRNEIQTASSVSAFPASEPIPPTTSLVTTTAEAPDDAGQAFVIAAASVPAGFELVAASNGLSFTTPPAPSFAGVLVTVGEDGHLTNPIVRIGTNLYAPNTADNVNKTPGFTSVEVPTQATVAVGDGAANYIETPGVPGPSGLLTWTRGAYNIWVTGPADRGLLSELAERCLITADGGVSLQPPANTRWFPGWQEWVEHRAFASYQGPDLTSVQITTAAAPAEGLEAFIVRTEQDITPLVNVNGRLTQVTRGQNGIRRLQFVESDRLVVIAQSSPWAETDLTKPLPLDDAGMLSLARSLQLEQGEGWASTVRRLTPTTAEERFDGKLLAGPRSIPLIGPHAATTNATIALRLSTFEGQPFEIDLANGGGGAGVPFMSVNGVYIDGGSRTGDDADHMMTTKTVQAGPRVTKLTVIQADGTQQPVAIVEPFAELLPGQRWGLIEYVADGARLKVTYTDGTSELLPLF